MAKSLVNTGGTTERPLWVDIKSYYWSPDREENTKQKSTIFQRTQIIYNLVYLSSIRTSICSLKILAHITECNVMLLQASYRHNHMDLPNAIQALY